MLINAYPLNEPGAINDWAYLSAYKYAFFPQLSDNLVLMDGDVRRTYVITDSEALALLDSITATVIPGGGGGGTVYTRTLNDFVIYVTDTSNVTRTINKWVAESLLLNTDQLVRTVLRNVWMADQMTLADGLVQQVLRTRIMVDTLLLVDSFVKSITSGGVINTITLNDGLIITDGIVKLTLRQRQMVEVITLADQSLKQRLAGVTTSDAMLLSDGSIVSAVRGHVASDQVTLLDAMIRSVLRQPTLSDGINLLDNLQQFRMLFRALTDNLTLIDNVIKVIVSAGTTYVVKKDDTLVLSDGVQTVRLLVRLFTDGPLTMSDLAVVSAIRGRNLGDAIAKLIDDVQKVRFKTFDDKLTPTDQALKFLLKTVQMSDAVVTSDQLLRSLALYRRVDDFFGISDAMTPIYISDIASHYDNRIIIGASIDATPVLGAAYDGMPMVWVDPSDVVISMSWDGMPVAGVDNPPIELGGYN